MTERLEFRGSSTALFGDILVVAVLSTLTVGIYLPWGVARMRKAALERTYYRGEALRYDGTGGELFGIYLKTFLLSLITLGIYAFLCYPSVALLRYDTSHTILPDGSRLEYRGASGELFGQLLGIVLLSAITLGIYSFWGYASMRRHILSHTYSPHGALGFAGTGGEFLGVALVTALLSAITLGIYDLLGCAMVRQLRWDTSSTEMPLMPGLPPATASVDAGRPIQVNVTVNR
jgi:uncharacterized membrane protein YjgN (DUF898 family)